MHPDEIAVGKGYERGLQARGPFGAYMRWYLGRRRPVEVPTVLEVLGDGPYRRILDAGCGTGLWLEDLYRRGHGQEMLAGVDVSAMMAGHARRRLAEVIGPDTKVRVENCSACEMPFRAGSFDLVMANAMVKHLEDEPLGWFLTDAHRMLKPGGRISIWDFGRPLLRLPDVKVDNPALELKNLRTSDALVRALKDAGFAEARPYTLKRPWRMPVTLEGAVATRA